MQSLLGHVDVSTTMIYTHALKVGGGDVKSPLDALAAYPPAAPGEALVAREPACTYKVVLRTAA